MLARAAVDGARRHRRDLPRSTDAELARYVACGEWRERAGAYAIQGVGSALVERVDGDYFNVVGLPVAALVRRSPRSASAPFSWLSGPDAILARPREGKPAGGELSLARPPARPAARAPVAMP